MPQICHEHCPGGGSGIGAVALVLALAAAASAAAILIEDVLAAALTAGIILSVIGVVFVVYRLRRDGLRLWRPGDGRPAVQSLPVVAAAISARRPLAIEGRYEVINGVVLSEETHAER